MSKHHRNSMAAWPTASADGTHSYLFPCSDTPVAFSLWPKFEGTVITCIVDETEPIHIRGEVSRVVHFEYEGGCASSETGYRSYFIRLRHAPSIALGMIEHAAIEYAQDWANTYSLVTQLTLF